MQYILEYNAHLLVTAQDVFGADLVTEAWIVYTPEWTAEAITALRDSILPCGYTKEFRAYDAEIALGLSNGRRVLMRVAQWTLLRDITGNNQYLLRTV